MRYFESWERERVGKNGRKKKKMRDLERRKKLGGDNWPSLRELRWGEVTQSYQNSHPKQWVEIIVLFHLFSPKMHLIVLELKIFVMVSKHHKYLWSFHLSEKKSSASRATMCSLLNYPNLYKLARFKLFLKKYIENFHVVWLE